MKKIYSFFAGIIVSVVLFSLFSFSTEEPVTEYAMLRVYQGYKEEVVFYANGEAQGQTLKLKNRELEAETNRMLNEYLQAGWRIISTDFLAGVDGDGIRNVKYYHLERTKR